jgi:hypothetical protein
VGGSAVQKKTKIELIVGIAAAVISAVALIVVALIGKSSGAKPDPPKPSVNITSPAEGEEVTSVATARGTATVSPEVELWVLLYAPGAEKYYIPIQHPIPTAKDNAWVADLSIGRSSGEDAGSKYEIWALLTSADGSGVIRNAVGENGESPSLKQLPPDIKANDRVRVTLKGGASTSPPLPSPRDSGSLPTPKSSPRTTPLAKVPQPSSPSSPTPTRSVTTPPRPDSNPSAGPSTTPTPLSPLVKITSPTDGGGVPHLVTANGTANVTPGLELWVLVYAPGAGKYYIATAEPLSADVSGNWSIDLVIGRATGEDQGAQYQIWALLTSTDGSSAIRNAIAHPQNGDAPFVTELPTNQAKDHVSVTLRA